MSKKGCSPDNSACEGFFGHLKNEMFYFKDWAGVSISQFIDILDPRGAQSSFSGAGKIDVFSPVIVALLQLLEKKW